MRSKLMLASEGTNAQMQYQNALQETKMVMTSTLVLHQKKPNKHVSNLVCQYMQEDLPVIA